jgi:uncharacterized membrane protein
VRPEHFFDHLRVHQAVQSAERGSSGRIVVYVSHRKVSDAMETAHRLFRHLSMETANQKAGLLLFFSPKSKKFAILGGSGLRDKQSQTWWDQLAGMVKRNFESGRYTEGVVAVLEESGKALKARFPSTKARVAGEKDVIEK